MSEHDAASAVSKGALSVNSENILPIIKKWLYSDSDIFVRELVSNAADAITKLKKLKAVGEPDAQTPDDEKFFINVTLDRENKTISFTDNGIGMTREEINEYINEIAFSGASAFLEKYKDAKDAANEIIGHFGLGFYSSFMHADTVEIDTLSYKSGAAPAHWKCSGGVEYELSDGGRKSRGTTVTLRMGESGKDFLDTYKLRQVLNKYCSFIPVEIYYDTVKTAAEIKKEEKDKEKRLKDAEKAAKDKGETFDAASFEASERPAEPAPINDILPLWLKKPSDCTDDEYKAFYRKVFFDFTEPLFWIHLNMDYPFRLKGILYFPKLKHELESIEGQVKLYNNQVFIADNLKEVIPEFLLLLKGALDCPDLPLNVSRSFLQNDGYVTKMSNYITKKVADKLNSLFKNDREKYNAYWDDINPFIKYGCIKERSFYDKIKDSIIYKTINGEYVTLADYLEKAKEKHENICFYVSNTQQQAQYIKLFKDFGLDAVLAQTKLDAPFMSYLESYNTDVKFSRIDSDISESLKESGADGTDGEAVEAVFKKFLNGDALKIKVEALKSQSLPAIILLPEHSRRMREMSAMFGGMDAFGQDADETLVLNKNNGLIKTLVELAGDASREDDCRTICEHIYDLALLGHKPLETDAMNRFLERDARILHQIAAKGSGPV